MVVCDTSVVFKWFSTAQEKDLPFALKLLELHLHHKETITAPDIILYELGNAWATKTKLKPIKIKTFLADLDNTDLTIEVATCKISMLLCTILQSSEAKTLKNTSNFD